MEALSAGKRLTGRQILWLIDENFQWAKADDDDFGMEALLMCSMKNDDLQKFLTDWEFWVSGSEIQLEEPMLESLLLRQLRNVPTYGTRSALMKTSRRETKGAGTPSCWV